MTYMDDIKDKTSDTGSMKERLEQLRSQAEAGELDDKGREELRELSERFGDKK